jgi:hypothetical protein
MIGHHRDTENTGGVGFSNGLLSPVKNEKNV